MYCAKHELFIHGGGTTLTLAELIVNSTHGGPEMSFDPLRERGIPIENQLRNWSELNTKPYNKGDVHPYSRCRGIVANGVEVESIMFQHQMARNTLDPVLKRQLAMVRRSEQQQQKAINWLTPGDETTLEVTIGYEQVAVDLTAWLAQNEPDPYLKQCYEFGILEDFDHLYRYANLYELLEGKKAEKITDRFTEMTPGRPTIFEHRDPRDEIRRPMTAMAAHPQSILNAITIVAAEQQTMNYYMTIGNRFQEPIARALYAEIGMIEEQHVSHYESILDPTASWIENWLLHEYNECWIYWSFMQDEVDPRVRSLYELHLNMEIEHLRIAAEMMRQVERRDPEAVLPATGFTAPLVFKENREYLREVLASQIDLTSKLSDFVPVTQLPQDDRYFTYNRTVNGDWTPSEAVIEENRAKNGKEYRLEVDGPNPVPGLRTPQERNGESTEYARRAA